MKILFFGSDSFAIPALHALHQSEHKILGVMTQPDKKAGRGQEITPCPIAVEAEKLNLPILKPETLNDAEIQKTLLNFNADVLVIVAYGKKIPKILIDKTKYEGVNIHPSLLPKYRGAAPIQWAILNGDRETGVSTMKIAEVMDSGDIYLQTKIPLGAEENTETLWKKLSELGASLLIETLDRLEKGKIKSVAQDSSKVVPAPKFEKEAGHLNWNDTAKSIHNRIRALNPWPGTFSFLNHQRIKILRSKILNQTFNEKPGTLIANANGLVVVCGQEALQLLEVQLEGKNKMAAPDFIKGFPIPKGSFLT